MLAFLQNYYENKQLVDAEAIVESCANGGEYTENNMQCKTVNYDLKKFLSASAWSSI